MARKMLFLFNPMAGKEQIRGKLLDILDCFTKADFEVTVYPTQKSGDATEQIMARAREYEVITVSGGDGTMSEAVNGLMHLPKEDRPLLGYIPAGTTNDYAATLGIPRNMKKAAEQLVQGNPFPCDIGRFQQSYFTYVAAFGAFTDVAYDTPQGQKNLLGHMAYILEGVKRLPSLRSYRVEIEHDGEMLEKGDYLFGMVSNASSVAGFKGVGGKSIELNDGLFEVLLIKRPANPIELQLTLTDLLRQDFESPRMVSFKAAQVKFIFSEPASWTLDGEYGGTHMQTEIENQKEAISILI